MPLDRLERRRGRRVSLRAPLLLRRTDGTAGVPFAHETHNISLAGTYFEVSAPQPFTLNEILMTSIAVPETQRREFPFTRIAGRGRVVRIEELPASDRVPARYGVAVEFGDDVIALAALPPRG